MTPLLPIRPRREESFLDFKLLPPSPNWIGQGGNLPLPPRNMGLLAMGPSELF
jgi:hypothetical protein